MTVKHLFPAAKPTVSFDFANSLALDPRIDFERASIGTYVDANGFVRYAQQNEPRFDHDPETGRSLGLLVEEKRTNILEYSSDFSATWDSSTFGSIALNDTVSPDGTQNAAKFTADGASNAFLNSGVFQTFTNIAAATKYSVSVFIKNDNADTVSVRAGSLNNRYTGAVLDFTGDEPSLTAAGGGGGTETNLELKKFPNDWYKVSYTGELPANQTNRVSILPDSTNSAFVFGAQVELGNFSTSYFPTAGAADDRAVDIAEITGNNFSNWYNKSEGTYLARFESRFPNKEDTTVMQVTNNTTRIFAYDNYNRVQFKYSPSAVVFSNTSTTGYPAAAKSSIAAMFYTDDGLNHTVGGSYMGSAVVSANGTGAINNNQLTLAYFPGAEGSLQSSSAHLARLAYYPERLTDDQLVALTS